jgi:FixJ family two-component response regulator
MISSVGLDVEAFASAEELLESGHIHDSSCLVLDLRLPGINGFDLQCHLTTSGCAVPIIFVTTEMGEEIRERAMQAGAAGFFNKPFSSDSFLQAVRTAGRQKRVTEAGSARLARTKSAEASADGPSQPVGSPSGRVMESCPQEESAQ